MKRSDKNNFIQNLKEELKDSSSVVVAHYTGLSVAETDNLRKEMRSNGAKFKVTKNRLTKIALTGTPYESIEDLFTGPTAVALSKDAITSAKILTNFSKENSNLKILGGIMGNDILDVTGVKNVATLPTLDEARAKIVGILRSPAQKIASILLAPASKIAILALEKSKK